MEVHFTHEQEAQLAQIANKVGIDAELLVKEAALRLLAGNDSQAAAPNSARRSLPVWHLGGVIGSLHRRDIYDDVP